MIFGAPTLDLSRPQVMGILNVTPDSFSDGGRFFDGGLRIERVIDEAAGMLAAGASILDVGGESTRPGAEPVPEQAELDRVVPVVEALCARFSAVISVDTSRASVMTAAARGGAGLINDVRALTAEGALSAAAATGLPVCLMHMRGKPKTMQAAPQYSDVVAEVEQFLGERVQACLAAGIGPDRLILDPGFGFGKSLEHNLQLFRAISHFAKQYPLLVGVSRKSMVGQICGREVPERLAGSLAFALLAAQAGAHILRVHDVAETCDLLKVLTAVHGQL
ncbi:dihydropteroate synthase [Simiduia sp. 21SJ11W-1]|uniref:dihydropteroate synthase n=1 Tax=Simiduia sp. 21SJ11W-1 TaxID=2909669 RepID=UPI0020A090D7|nr:dihydropteroate synthase [Simiduia sp. 21SJ11W-1]UTA47028.1 dihydropteroate synthase [Simiduia sp. 21SJ11W-1]